MNFMLVDLIRIKTIIEEKKKGREGIELFIG